jgi:hypothetical protein
VTDSYAYAQSIDYTIEHGPEGNLTPTDYAAVVFFYSAAPPPAGDSLPPVAARKVSDPRKIVFVPGRNVGRSREPPTRRSGASYLIRWKAV